MCSAVEIVGFCARIVSRYDLTSTTPYIIQLLCILLAPILLAASIYMFLGRLMRASGYPEYSIIRVNYLTKIFVCGDVLCFLVQAAGAAKLVNAKTADDIDTSQDIILGGLLLQVAILCFFVVVALVFHVRLRRHHVLETVDPGLTLPRMLVSLYAASLLVIVRNIYRFFEYKLGQKGYLLEHEWPMYAFDTIHMALVMIFTSLWYMADLSPRPKPVLLEEFRQDGYHEAGQAY